MSEEAATEPTGFLPVLAVIGAALVWGTLWIPMRQIDQAGFTGGWSPVLIFGTASAIMLPLAAIRWRRLVAGGWPLILVGTATGSSTVLFADALIYGEVARTILIFYMLPVWTTLFGRLIVGDRITLARGLTVACGLTGLVIILGYRGGVPLPRTVPEWMTVASSLLFALSITFMRVTRALPDFEKVAIQFLTGALFAVALTYVPQIASHGTPDRATMIAVLPWAAAAAFLWILPGMWMNFWGARWLAPGLVGILMMTEVLFGVVSAHFVAGESLGPSELAGGALILGAGLADILIHNPGRLSSLFRRQPNA